MSNIDEINKCRICLKNGIIPIYGENCKSDLSFDVRTFGDIDIFEDDEYPKYLCNACSKLLRCAIVFRNTAKRSDDILKRSMKSETDPNDSESLTTSINSADLNSKVNSSLELVHKYFKEVSLVHQDDESSKRPVVCHSKLRINKLQCSVCHKIISKNHARDHYAIHDPSLAKYVCDICGKSFRQRSGCINHRQTHSTEFKFKCNLCPYRSNISALLKLHARIHAADYRYLCTKCPARFLTKSNFNKHSLKHKDPQFKCDHCKTRFHSKAPLENHIQAIHLGLKNHVCNICGQAYGYRKAVLNHQVKVHMRKKRSKGRIPAYLKAQIQEQKEDKKLINNINDRPVKSISQTI